MRKHAGRWVAILTGAIGILVLVSLLGFHRRLEEDWYLRELRSRNEAARLKAAEELARLKSIRAIPHLIAAIRNEKRENVEIGFLLHMGRTGRDSRFAFRTPPVRRLGGPFDVENHCLVLSPIGHSLHAMGKEGMASVNGYTESVTFFDEEVQRHLDVLEAIVRAWSDPRITVERRDYQAGAADLTPKQ